MTARRGELAVAVGLCLLSAAVLLVAAGQPWIRVQARVGAPTAARSDAFRAVDLAVVGRDLSPAPAAVGLVALAAAIAIVATRGSGRRLLGLALVGAGVAAALAAADPARAPRAAGADTAVVRREIGLLPASAGVSATAWPGASIAGGVLLASGGALAAARGGRWSAMSARYRPPSDAAPAAVEPDVALWDALDRGDDPT
ncbi:MAG TPA: Trp biosynthesis-associated membrane protein [Mycobacteriales bacterium]|nr:Trp biosynthesis-associated membrane protein [Mycobacteriales bacterium]